MIQLRERLNSCDWVDLSYLAWCFCSWDTPRNNNRTQSTSWSDLRYTLCRTFCTFPKCFLLGFLQPSCVSGSPWSKFSPFIGEIGSIFAQRNIVNIFQFFSVSLNGKPNSQTAVSVWKPWSQRPCSRLRRIRSVHSTRISRLGPLSWETNSR